MNRPRLPQDNVTATNCTCLLCLADKIARPSVFVPAEGGRPARWLHGKELETWWTARDRVRQLLQGLTGSDALGSGQ